MIEADDMRRIDLAIHLHGPRYFGGPCGFGRSDTARYVTEGHLRNLVERHSLRVVWDTVAERLADYTDEDLAGGHLATIDRGQEHAARMEAIWTAADKAYRDGNVPTAIEFLRGGHAADPDHCPRPGRTWADLVAILETPEV
jgi:hypothetical protein